MTTDFPDSEEFGLKSQMRLANSLNMRFCVIVGEDELRENMVTLRDLKGQSQKKVPIADIIHILKEELKKGSG